ncbi:hypothetical protein J4573_08025 [Actinomadura barringtoniae]|uniref:AAA+ ATPase domain-containing protein n=1 Tax=Actinomadura barringtoniae TaxID=1427535 RepID=A0A939PBJ6_9ACTN|nr:hypothetical protein [Actinomadura barringtoniae]MBO2447033.1 hypothetical protein [Actinomadura barringtoniae]
MRHPLERRPNSPPFLAGRGRELGLLIQTLADTPLTVISGPPRVGKSALALRAAHLAAGLFPDGLLYLDLRGSPLHNVRTPRDTGGQATALLRNAAGRRVLVVLDNVDSAAQLQPWTPVTPGGAVIITSRHALTGPERARQLRLSALSFEDVQPEHTH